MAYYTEHSFSHHLDKTHKYPPFTYDKVGYRFSKFLISASWMIKLYPLISDKEMLVN